MNVGMKSTNYCCDHRNPEILGVFFGPCIHLKHHFVTVGSPRIGPAIRDTGCVLGGPWGWYRQSGMLWDSWAFQSHVPIIINSKAKLFTMCTPLCYCNCKRLLEPLSISELHLGPTLFFSPRLASLPE